MFDRILITGVRVVVSIVLLLLFCPAATAQAAEGDKTLVAWASPANLQQQGGSVLTVQRGNQFDAIVFGERVARRWMAGSDHFSRTQPDQTDNAAEIAGPDKLVQVAIVYDEGMIRIYRDGKQYARYNATNVDLLGDESHIALFGLRHLGSGSGSPLAGVIEDARIYDKALSQQQIQQLQADEAGDVKSLAWWDFEGEKVTDRAGHFTHHAMTDGVRVQDGRLHLDGQGYLVAALSEADAKRATHAESPQAPLPPYKPHTPAWPKNPPDNWLTFHLAHPGPGPAMPGDPNPAFDYKGRYHLHYIYNHNGFVFGHVSSDDLVHWKWQPTVLAPGTTGHGMFSGTGFFTKEGQPAMIYHGQGSGRNWIQYALDEKLNEWSEPEAVIPRDKDGKLLTSMPYFDPDVWIKDDTYYAINGRSSNTSAVLMKSDNLKDWDYIGELLHPDFDEKKLGVSREEDISCANMFQLGDKWVLVCISHRLGCRYFIGDFKNERYLPTFHGMMSFGGNQFFAPESMLTRDGRRVMWAWLMNMPIAPTGVQSLPRELELPADGVLRIRPLRELAKLRYDEVSRENITVQSGNAVSLDEATGDALELKLVVEAPLPETFAVELFADEHGEGGMRIVAGKGRKTLKVGSAEAPFELKDGEDLVLRIFIDKNLVEVFANDRQAVALAHGEVREDPNLRLSAEGGDAKVKSVKAWKMKSIYNDE